jgi:hypothetical protein
MYLSVARGPMVKNYPGGKEIKIWNIIIIIIRFLCMGRVQYTYIKKDGVQNPSPSKL